MNDSRKIKLQKCKKSKQLIASLYRKGKMITKSSHKKLSLLN